VQAAFPLYFYDSIIGTPPKYPFTHRKEVKLTHPLFSGIQYTALQYFLCLQNVEVHKLAF
jgi:hypothetical protein